MNKNALRVLVGIITFSAGFEFHQQIVSVEKLMIDYDHVVVEELPRPARPERVDEAFVARYRS